MEWRDVRRHLSLLGLILCHLALKAASVIRP
jgi:hypothetical protein